MLHIDINTHVTSSISSCLFLNLEVVPCSKEMPCQTGFLCSAEHACKPTGALLTLFPPTASQALKPVNINNGTLLRIVRKVNKQDEDSKSCL